MSTITPICRPITTRYRVNRPLLTLSRRLRRSAFAADLRRGWDRTRAVLGAFAIAYGFLVVVRGAWFAAYLAGVAK